ncbi:9574_t:CDS:2 [Paraglomus brasilianum]|uniref:Fucosyltransferase n=1 Tax=Paraglomus brasilianum TaxID=144538 RepID=A0A9N9DMT2_9GLOM|nr:9574_t:CDS:2 [Paraglomus brasilianum]
MLRSQRQKLLFLVFLALVLLTVLSYLAVPFLSDYFASCDQHTWSCSLRQHFVPVSSIYGEDVEPILLWTPWFGDSRSWLEGKNLHGLNENHTCVVTQYRAAKANMVLFHRPDLDANDLPTKQDGQMWVLYSGEPLHRYSGKNAKKLEALYPYFNYSLNYRLDSNFPIIYYDTKIMEQLSKPPPSFSPDVEPVAWIGSNCDAWNKRHFYIKELMKHIPVASYGSCLNNKPLAPRDQNVEYMSRHPFYLALENSNCDYYVTEKLQGSFAAGVVPIVTGPKNYSAFIPTPHSVIFLDDFRDPKDLAKHLRFLLERPEEYQKYIDFRFNPQLISEEFRKNWDGPNGWNRIIGLRRLCDTAWMYRTGKKLTSDNPEEDWMKPRVIEADSSCIDDKYAYVKELSD